MSVNHILKIGFFQENVIENDSMQLVLVTKKIKRERKSHVFTALVAGNSHYLHTAPELEAFCQKIHLTESHFCQSVLQRDREPKSSVTLDELAVRIRIEL